MDLATLPREHEQVLQVLVEFLLTMKYGEITVVVHSGRVTRITRTDSILVGQKPNT